MFIHRDPVNLEIFYESHLHFCSDLCIKLVEIYTSQPSVTPSQTALRLDDLLEANGSVPVVICNWKSIGDKKIYGNNDLPEQGHKEHWVSEGAEGGTHLFLTSISILQSLLQTLLLQGTQTQGCVAHTPLTRAWMLQGSSEQLYSLQMKVKVLGPSLPHPRSSPLLH